jgi:hypothetical protein
LDAEGKIDRRKEGLGQIKATHFDITQLFLFFYNKKYYEQKKDAFSLANWTCLVAFFRAESFWQKFERSVMETPKWLRKISIQKNKRII